MACDILKYSLLTTSIICCTFPIICYIPTQHNLSKHTNGLNYTPLACTCARYDNHKMLPSHYVWFWHLKTRYVHPGWFSCPRGTPREPDSVVSVSFSLSQAEIIDWPPASRRPPCPLRPRGLGLGCPISAAQSERRRRA